MVSIFYKMLPFRTIIQNDCSFQIYDFGFFRFTTWNFRFTTLTACVLAFSLFWYRVGKIYFSLLAAPGTRQLCWHSSSGCPCACKRAAHLSTLIRDRNPAVPPWLMRSHSLFLPLSPVLRCIFIQGSKAGSGHYHLEIFQRLLLLLCTLLCFARSFNCAFLQKGFPLWRLPVRTIPFLRHVFLTENIFRLCRMHGQTALCTFSDAVSWL